MICGNKVILKKFKISDINESYMSWLKNKTLLRFSNNRFIKQNKKKLISFYKNMQKKNKFFFKIITKEEKEFIGTITSYIDVNHNTANLGILIGNNNYYNSGYGFDAWKTMLKFLMEKKKIRKVFAGTLSENKSMIKIFKKSKMKFESKFIRHEKFEKKYIDIVFYSIFK